MIQLLYLSTSSHPVTRNLIDEICAEAKILNLRHGITGVLLSRGDRFLQALEGPQMSVEDTFLRLINDSRHHAITVLSRRKVTCRTFGELRMRYCSSADSCFEVYKHINIILENASEMAKSQFAVFAT